MTRKRILYLLPWLFGYLSLSALAQQPSPQPPATSASPQATTPQQKSNKRKRTADGVPLCPADDNLPDGVYKISNGVTISNGITPPKLTRAVEAKLSEEALEFVRDQHIKDFYDLSVLQVIVDTKGRPTKVCVLKEAGHNLDRKAYQAVSDYQFKPATLDGKPVPVHMQIIVAFHTY